MYKLAIFSDGVTIYQDIFWKSPDPKNLFTVFQYGFTTIVMREIRDLITYFRIYLPTKFPQFPTKSSMKKISKIKKNMDTFYSGLFRTLLS